MSVLPNALNKLRQDFTKAQTKKAAWNIIEEYFNFFGLYDIHDELWLLTAGMLTNDEMEQTEKGTDKHNLIFFFEFTKMFAEAAHLLHNKRQKKQKQLTNNNSFPNYKPGANNKANSRDLSKKKIYNQPDRLKK